jgi:membrane protease subunit HflK
MAWNEPGKSGGDKDKDPWDKQRGEQGPPDLEDIVKNLQNKVTSLFGGRRGGGGGGARSGRGGDSGMGGIITIAVILLVVWLLYSSIYILNERQNGVVLRFGQYVTTIQPGFNLRLPYPIETVDVVDVQAVRAFNIGQGTNEALMLTKDKNIVDIEYVVQYQVGDAKQFVLNTRDPLISLEHAAHTAVREMVGQNEMEYVQTQGRAEFAQKSKERIQQILDRYQTGLLIISFEMQKAQAPRPVIPAYEEVNAAQQEKEAEINKAEAFSNTIIPKAEGEANRIREQAQQYQETLVARASGDAQRFTQLLTQYELAPRVTRERLYLETMQDILGRSKKVIIDVNKGNSMIYLPLDQIVPKDLLKRESSGGSETNQREFGLNAELPNTTSDRSRTRSRER